MPSDVAPARRPGPARAAHTLALALVAGLLSLGPTSSAAVAPDADRSPGPALSVTRAQLDRALECRGGLRSARRDPVLLTPAFSTGAQSYGAGYARQLPEVGHPTCVLSLPDRGFRDLQHAAEYVVRAVRLMSRRSGRDVALLGHQHGALDARWAVTFWPDLRHRVSDVISLATPHTGTDGARALCADGLRRCPPSFWQISTGSDFLAALAARRLPRGPAWTSIATDYDELIVPQPRASHLRGGTNISLQDVCAVHPVEHFSILFDRLTYRLVLDALRHRGPARPRRLPASVCGGPSTMPGVTDPASLVTLLAGAVGFTAGFVLGIPTEAVDAEPRLRRYAR